MLTVVSHEYDAERNIDNYVFDPGKMKAQIRINIKEDGTPQVLLGVAGMAVQIAETAEAGADPSWTVCPNKEICEIALADYAARQ